MSTDLVSTKQAAALRGVSVTTIHRLVASGHLTPVAKLDGIRGAMMFRREDVEALEQPRGRWVRVQEPESAA